MFLGLRIYQLTILNMLMINDVFIFFKGTDTSLHGSYFIVYFLNSKVISLNILQFKSFTKSF